MGVEEGRAARSQFVDVGSFRERMPTHMADPIVLIVDGNEDYVWFGSAERGRRDYGGEKREGSQKGDGFHRDGGMGFLRGVRREPREAACAQLLWEIH